MTNREIARVVGRAAVLAMAMLLVAQTASADCGSFGRQAWPKGETKLPVNGRIVIEDHDFYGGEGIGKAAAKGAALVTKGEKEIALELVELLPGTFGKGVQAVLVPSRTLTPGKPYSVRIGGKDFVTILTGDAVDTSAPRWIEEPAFEKMHWIGYGCGPSKQVFFAMKVTDDSPGLRIRVDLLKEGDSKENTASYFVEPKDGRVSVGHGMCYGGFELEDGATYTATFTAVDTTGNASPARLPIQFTAPTPKDGGSDE